MKKLKLFIFIALIGFLASACDRDITEPLISSNPTTPSVADAVFTANFTIANADSLMRFSWSASNFGFQSSTTYALQLSPSSTFASDVATIVSTQQLSASVKVADINALLLSWNKEIGQAATVYYRVASSVNSDYVVYSGIKSKSLIPYETLIDYPMVYAPGSYQGWSPGNVNGRLYSYGFNSQYSGIIRLVDGANANVEFKITSIAAWSGTNWGGSLTKTGSNYSGSLDPNGGNFVVAAGTYRITVDVSALTISLTKTDDWGIIGSAVPPYDWSRDVDLFYNGQRKMWEITADFHAGDIKFRANDGWDNNLGDSGANGTLDPGGDNIVLPGGAGNYTIRMDPDRKIYTIKKN